MWAVLYDDGTSLTTVSEPIARSLAEAERQRGHRVTIRRLDDGADTAPEPEPEPIRLAEPFARPEPISEPSPTPHPSLTPHPSRPRLRSSRRGLRSRGERWSRRGLQSRGERWSRRGPGAGPGARAGPRTRTGREPTGPCGQACERPQTPALRARRRQHRRRCLPGRSLGCAAQSGCHDQLQPGAGQQPSPSSAAATSAGSAAGHALQQRGPREVPGRMTVIRT